MKADPTKLHWRQGDEETTTDTLVYRLDVECMFGATENSKPVNQYVYSSQLQWVPQSNQEEIFTGKT